MCELKVEKVTYSENKNTIDFTVELSNNEKYTYEVGYIYQAGRYIKPKFEIEGQLNTHAHKVAERFWEDGEMYWRSCDMKIIRKMTNAELMSYKRIESIYH